MGRNFQFLGLENLGGLSDWDKFWVDEVKFTTCLAVVIWSRLALENGEASLNRLEEMPKAQLVSGVWKFLSTCVDL
jgi:hypothetical protein